MPNRPGRLPIAIAAGLLALTACGDFDPAKASADKSSTTRSQTVTAQPSADNFTRSLAIFRLILNDVEANFDGEAGGGVTRIVSEATNTYAVSLSKEERVVTYTYTIDNGPDGKPRITSKTESVKSHGH